MICFGESELLQPNQIKSNPQISRIEYRITHGDGLCQHKMSAKLCFRVEVTFNS